MNRPEILDAAKKCVCGQREQDYGSPENNFERIANLWNAYLGTQTVSAVDVAMMLGLLKIARIKTGKGTADSFVDLAGYAACGGEIATQGSELKEIPIRGVDRCVCCGNPIPEGRLVCAMCEHKYTKLDDRERAYAHLHKATDDLDKTAKAFLKKVATAIERSKE